MSLGSAAPLQCFIVGRLLLPAHALHMAEYLPLSAYSPPLCARPSACLFDQSAEEERQAHSAVMLGFIGLALGHCVWIIASFCGSRTRARSRLEALPAQGQGA